MDKERIPVPRPLLEEEGIKILIKSRNIRQEDFYILEELASISKQLIIKDFHNFFSFNRARSAEELRSMMRYLVEDSERKKVYGLLLDFVQKYDWAAAWNLIAVFERRK